MATAFDSILTRLKATLERQQELVEKTRSEIIALEQLAGIQVQLPLAKGK